MTEDEQTVEYRWAFRCPVHGLEISVFCFRAFDPKNMDKWLLGKITFEEPTDEQRDAFIKSFRERAKLNSRPLAV